MNGEHERGFYVHLRCFLGRLRRYGFRWRCRVDPGHAEWVDWEVGLLKAGEEGRAERLSGPRPLLVRRLLFHRLLKPDSIQCLEQLIWTSVLLLRLIFSITLISRMLRTLLFDQMLGLYTRRPDNTEKSSLQGEPT